MADRRAEATAAAWVAAGSTLAILLALRELLPRFGSAIGPTKGDPHFTLTILEWCSSRWSHALAGVWSPPYFFPVKGGLVLSDHMLFPSLVYTLLRGIGASPAWAHNVLLVASFSLTAAAIYLLLRRAARGSRAVIAALALAVTFAPWRWGQLVHLLMLFAPGPPIAIWTFDRLLARPNWRRSLAFGAAEAVTLLSGCYLAFLTQLALLFVVAVRLPRRGQRRRWARSWRPLALGAALAAGCAVPVYAPYLAARSEMDQRRSPKEIRAFDVELRDLFTPSELSLYAGRLLPVSEKRSGRELFPGALLLVGALVGGASWVRIRFARPRFRNGRPALPMLGRALLLAGMFFGLLSNARLFLIVSRFVPGLDSMRVPSRGYFFVLVALAVLSSWGLNHLLRTARTRTARTALVVLVYGLVACDVLAKPVAAGEFSVPETRSSLPPHVLWLARDDVRAVAIFPLTGDWPESRRMWRQQFHGRPIANGYSSFLPQSFRWLRSQCRTPLNRLLPRCVDAMDALGISHVVVEDAWYAAPGSPVPNRVEAAVAPELAGRVRLLFSDEEALVFALDPMNSELPMRNE